MNKVNREIRRGQVYFTDLGEGEGSELEKIRPCVVVQNDVGNYHSPTTIIIPITHRFRNKYIPTQVVLKEDMFVQEEKRKRYVDGVLLAEQMRVVSKTRLRELVGELVPEALEEVEGIIKISVGLKSTKKNAFK